MPKKFIKKYMPDHKVIREHKHLKVFGRLLHDANLWHFNRRSVSGAFAVGLFCAFIPIPLQMLIAAAVAILVRVNLPISVSLVWITNPITIPPMFYVAYKIGAFTMGQEVITSHYQLSAKWFTEQIDLIWQPFLLGCLISGVVSALVGFALIRVLWRLHIIRHIQERKARFNKNRQATENNP